MQGKDKVSQLKDSIQARQQAEAKKATQTEGEVSPGMRDRYEQKITELEQALQEALAQVDSLKEKTSQAQDDFLRKHAEFENFRKRMEREKLESAKYSHEKMALELLPVLDSFEKALEHADASHDFDDLMNGVQMVLKQFLQALAKFGLVPVDAQGKAFDPNFHEAVGHQESAELPPHHVVEEYRRGYRLHDRLLRPAMVSVSKKPEKEKD